MEHELPRLGEALTEERSWEWEGVTVLTASVSLPQLAGAGGRVRRFNRYYRRVCRAYLARCARLLLPAAAESCRAAMAVSAPWHAARAELRWRVSREGNGVLSLVYDVREDICGEAPVLLRRAEVWELASCLPVPPEEFFPPRAHVKRLLLRFARAELARRAEQGAALRGDWRLRLRRALNTRNWYLTDEGLCFFCQSGALAAAREGAVAFTLPYDEENGPFPRLRKNA